MASRIAALSVSIVLLCASASAFGATDASVRLSAPSKARQPSVRALVQVRDCNTDPTVAIRARWRRAPGEAKLRVSGLVRVLRRTPRPAEPQANKIVYHKVPRGTPIRALLITTWREKPSGSSCKVHLPTLVGTGAAARGVVRLRTMLPLTTTEKLPDRGTGLDYIWTCGGDADFDCGQEVTIGSGDTAGDPPQGQEDPPDQKDPKDPTDEKKCDEGCNDGGDGDDSDLAKILTILVTLLGGGGIAAAARQTPKRAAEKAAEAAEKEDDERATATWDELARQEYVKPVEPVASQAAFITKVGAPTAALIGSFLTAAGGIAVGAPEGPRTIAVGIVVAVSTAGVLYVFATDFRARAAVAVVRFESLAKQATAEARATAKVQSQADKAAADAKKASQEATKAHAEAKQAKADAAQARVEAKQARAQLDKCLAKLPTPPEEPTPGEPTPDEPQPDEPTPDEPQPDEPTPDEPQPDEPTPD